VVGEVVVAVVIETRKVEIIAMTVEIETVSPWLRVQNVTRGPMIGKTINPTLTIAVSVAEGHADEVVVEVASVLNVKRKIQANLMTTSSMTMKN